MMALTFMVALPSYNLGVALHLHRAEPSARSMPRTEEIWGALHAAPAKLRGGRQGKRGTVDR